MFVLTTLVYPLVLALLCVGAGLLVDRASGGVLPAMLFPAVGAAALVAVSQLSTYVAPIAPATPYLLVAVALAGGLLGWERLRALGGAWQNSLWQLLVGPLAYALALAPVLLAGRPSFSSYMALADSAVHMLGADFLIHHGQDYSHLDVHNSYGAFMSAYYGSSYPSGADTLLGGGTSLLRLPLIWTFQPFTAFMLATATGPAWVLMRRVGLQGAWAAAATLTVTLPALVYAYELIGSVKEIVALPLILSMGALVVGHRRWLSTGARAAIPFALVVAGGVAALGVAFGAWALAATSVLVLAAIAESGKGDSQEARGRGEAPGKSEWGSGVRRTEPTRRRSRSRHLGGLFAAGALLLLVAAWPTWAQLSGSLHVAGAIASTSNPGNLHSPLHATQLFGIWLGGSYKVLPTGAALTLTSVLVALVFALAMVGVGNLVSAGRYTLAGWVASMIVLWLALHTYATTWADAKTLMLTSPVVVLVAWAGIAALRASPLRLAAPLVASLLVVGVLVSDALQYHSSNLAPTARYDELAAVNTRFAGGGPTLFADFDEYSLYELRNMDVGGPDFAYPPPALAAAAGGYGEPVKLDRIAPAALRAYPLIVTRRDPPAARPPAAYRLLWEGAYYQVWGRTPGASVALAHVTVLGSLRSQCTQVARIARIVHLAGASRTGTRLGGAAQPRRGVVGGALDGAGSASSRLLGAVPAGARLIAAIAPELVALPLARTHRPPGWKLVREGIVMGRAGTLNADFQLPHSGVWELWLKGNIMREVHVAIDGRALGSLGAQLDGNSLVANPLTPLSATLSAGSHTLMISRLGAGLAPGDGGAAVLAGVFLTPAGPSGRARLKATPVGGWRSVCGHDLQWVEVVSGA